MIMRLLECYLPVFTLIARLEYHTEEFADYEGFHRQCIMYLEQSVKDAEQLALSDKEKDDALFAVVVWLDERVLCSSLPDSQRWRTGLMQRRYFHTAVGGNEFFVRLNTLAEEHQQARVVYLFCLQRGFHGKYGTQNAEELTIVIEQQRQYCLPQNWQVWPNNEAITPVTIAQSCSPSAKIRRVTWVLLGISLLYGVLLLVQSLYFL